MPRPRTKTHAELRAYQRAWAKSNSERLAALRSAPARVSAKQAYDRARYQAKAEILKARALAAYAADPARGVARAKAWAARNADKVRKIKRAWKVCNPEKARRSNVRGKATTEQIAARVAYFGDVCAYCGGPFQHIDHVIPLARGGTGWPANLRPACAPCNQTKHARPLAEFLARRAK